LVGLIENVVVERVLEGMNPKIKRLRVVGRVERVI
jgi:hypothetical protein